LVNVHQTMRDRFLIGSLEKSQLPARFISKLKMAFPGLQISAFVSINIVSALKKLAKYNFVW